MLFALALYIGLPALLAVLTYLIVSLKKSGYFDDVHIVVLEDPLILSDNITVFYKYCVAGKCRQVYSEVADILPKELTKLFGIFYDNGDAQQMAAVGCVFESGGNQLFQASYAMQLTRWVGFAYKNDKVTHTVNLQGFEQMVLPKVEKAIHSQQKSISGCFANLALLRMRDKIKTFSKAKNLESTISIEIYDRQADSVDIFRPVHHLGEFCVPEYLIDTSGDNIGAQKLYRSNTSASEEISTTESGSQLGDEDASENIID